MCPTADQLMPPPPPGPEFVAWSLRMNAAYVKRRRTYLNRCIRAGLLPHMKEASYPELDVDTSRPIPLIVDPLMVHDG